VYVKKQVLIYNLMYNLAVCWSYCLRLILKTDSQANAIIDYLQLDGYVKNNFLLNHV